MRQMVASGTMSDYKQEHWVRLYHSALLELEHALMAGRLVDARAAIVNRIEQLRDMPGLHNEERRAIEEALMTLSVLELEDIRYAAEHRKAAYTALQSLGSLHPTVKGLKAGRPTLPEGPS